jgi:hypothetical protein
VPDMRVTGVGMGRPGPYVRRRSGRRRPGLPPSKHGSSRQSTCRPVVAVWHPRHVRAAVAGAVIIAVALAGTLFVTLSERAHDSIHGGTGSAPLPARAPSGLREYTLVYSDFDDITVVGDVLVSGPENSGMGAPSPRTGFIWLPSCRDRPRAAPRANSR